MTQGPKPTKRSGMSNLFETFSARVRDALDALAAEGVIPAGLDLKNVTVEPPRDASHGDLATNAAMVLAKPAGTNPRAIAGALAEKLAALPEVASA